MTARDRLKKLIPPSVRRSVDRLLRPLAAVPRSLRILTMKPLNDRLPHVYYGFGRIPKDTDYTHGGLVKIQHMQQTFPNSQRFNILYLVSSRIPYGAVQIAAMAQRKGAHLVWNQNGVAYPAWHGPGWEAVNAPLAKLLHGAAYVFYQSEFCRVSADRYLGVRKGPWEVLYNPVDTQTFVPAAANRDTRRVVMLLAGNQDQAYRVRTAIDVLSEVVRNGLDARLDITGRLGWTGDPKEAGKIAGQWVRDRDLGDRVRFTGPYTQRDAPDVYRQAHILLHTKFNDPCPGVVIEALACGVPVVYSHSGGVPELVGKDAGIGVPVENTWDRDIPADPKAMATAVMHVAARRDEFSRAARQRAMDTFDIRPWLKRHQIVFDRLVG